MTGVFYYSRLIGNPTLILVVRLCVQMFYEILETPIRFVAKLACEFVTLFDTPAIAFNITFV